MPYETLWHPISIFFACLFQSSGDEVRRGAGPGTMYTGAITSYGLLFVVYCKQKIMHYNV